MIKKKISLILALVMATGLISPGVVYGNDFTEHWAKDTIQQWFDNEMISGYDNGTFKPDKSITRAEFMTMVNSAYEFDNLTEINYTDVNSEEWYYSEIQKAVKAGYIIGDNENTVRPNEEITRQEVAVVITRLNTLDQNVDISMFNDKDEVADWAVGFVGAVAEAKYMIGDVNKRFCPEDDITRAEALVTLDRSMNDKEEVKNHAIISELSIEGAELEQAFDVEKTTYTAIKVVGVNEIKIVADVTTDAAISFSSNVTDSEIKVTTSSDIQGGVVHTANVPLSSVKDTVITVKVSREKLKEIIYTLTVKNQE